MARGAPLRFLAGTLGAWTIARVAMLWPADLPAPLLDAAPVFAATPAAPIVVVKVPEPLPADPPGGRRAGARPTTGTAVADAPGSPERQPRPPATAAEPSRTLPPLAATAPAPAAPPLSSVVRPVHGHARLTIDAWIVARRDGGDSLAFGQLGASQGGARLTYALDEGRRIALSARISAPRRGPGGELGVGVDLRPTRLPVHLLVEQRIALDRGGSRPAATVIAGGSAALPARARLDAYAQAGAVARRGGFADGAALAVRPVLARGVTRVEVGAGAWGAAQRRVARLDVGPSLALVEPAGGSAIRLQLDYRIRVAGRARPGAGPALTLGGSF